MARIKKYIINGSSAVLFILISAIIRLFAKVQKKKVLFISDVRAELGDSLKDVWDYLPDQYHKVTYLKADRRHFSTPGVYLRFVYDFTTAETILLEDYFRYTSYYTVREGQQICQLWHAAGAYKKFGYSRAGDGEGIRIHKGYRKYAKAITSADAIRPCYAEAFGISLDKVKATGVPRTDIFFDKAYVERRKEELYQKYPILKERKVVLFAPTYRGLRAEDAGYDFSQIELGKFRDELGDDYVFCFKWHPAVYNNILRNNKEAYQLEQYGDFYLDLSGYRDINDLLLIADVMITDYSSVIFDYLLVDKPVIFYAYDLDQYDGGRGMYFPFEEYCYGPVVTDQDQLISAIRAADLCPEKREAFREKFMSACDGHATEKTCRWIFGETDGNHS